MASSRSGFRTPAAQATETAEEVVAVPLPSLRPADSPRVNGEDKAHIAARFVVSGPCATDVK